MARLACLARADLADLVEVAVFHCFHGCVRRSYLCGDDPDTGRNYDDRKRWLEERLTFLASAFGIDLVVRQCRVYQWSRFVGWALLPVTGHVCDGQECPSY
jgi:hypothetical protein